MSAPIYGEVTKYKSKLYGHLWKPSQEAFDQGLLLANLFLDARCFRCFRCDKNPVNWYFFTCRLNLLSKGDDWHVPLIVFFLSKTLSIMRVLHKFVHCFELAKESIVNNRSALKIKTPSAYSNSLLVPFSLCRLLLINPCNIQSNIHNLAIVMIVLLIKLTVSPQSRHLSCKK